MRVACVAGAGFFRVKEDLRGEKRRGVEGSVVVAWPVYSNQRLLFRLMLGKQPKMLS